jgi:hypothetical protein
LRGIVLAGIGRILAGIGRSVGSGVVRWRSLGSTGSMASLGGLGLRLRFMVWAIVLQGTGATERGLVEAPLIEFGPLESVTCMSGLVLFKGERPAAAGEHTGMAKDLWLLGHGRQCRLDLLGRSHHIPHLKRGGGGSQGVVFFQPQTFLLPGAGFAGRFAIGTCIIKRSPRMPPIERTQRCLERCRL